MPIIIFTTDPPCPKCRVLKQKLDAANINYQIETNVEEIINAGFMTAPVLKIEDRYLDFGAAIKWINTL